MNWLLGWTELKAWSCDICPVWVRKKRFSCWAVSDCHLQSQCRLPMMFAISPLISPFLVSEVPNPIPFILYLSNFDFFVIFLSLLLISECKFVASEEWLVDRKRVPADWRKRLAVIRARISKEIPSLPKDSDPYFQTLDPEG